MTLFFGFQLRKLQTLFVWSKHFFLVFSRAAPGKICDRQVLQKIYLSVLGYGEVRTGGKKKKVAPQTLKLEGIDTWKMSPGKSGRLDCLRVALRCPILCVCVCTYGPLAFLLTAEPSLLKQRALSLVPFAHHPANFLLRGGGALHAAALSVRPSLLCVSVCVCPLLLATR